MAPSGELGVMDAHAPGSPPARGTDEGLAPPGAITSSERKKQPPEADFPLPARPALTRTRPPQPCRRMGPQVLY